MKRNIVWTAIVTVFFGALALSSAPSAQAQKCSLVGAAGKYGFTLTGTLLLPTGPVPIAAVGTAILEADGTGSGTEARNVGGDFSDETFTVTFTVNPDCTGAATLKFVQSGEIARTALVFDDDMKQIRQVVKSITVGDVNVPSVITVEARKMSPDDEQN